MKTMLPAALLALLPLFAQAQPATPAEPAQQAAKAPAPLKWAYNESTDATTRVVTRKAVLASTAPVELPYPFETSVRAFLSVGKEGKKPTEVRLWVTPGQIACPDSCEVRIQFGKAAALTLKAEAVADGTTSSVRLVEPAKVIAGLRRSKPAQVEIPLFEAGGLSFQFAPEQPLQWPYSK